jgi:hypothetical protein
MAGHFKLGAFDPIASVMYSSSHLTFYAPSVAFYRSSVRIYTSTEVNYALSLAFLVNPLLNLYFFDSLL